MIMISVKLQSFDVQPVLYLYFAEVLLRILNWKPKSNGSSCIILICETAGDFHMH